MINPSKGTFHRMAVEWGEGAVLPSWSWPIQKYPLKPSWLSYHPSQAYPLKDSEEVVAYPGEVLLIPDQVFGSSKVETDSHATSWHKNSTKAIPCVELSLAAHLHL